MPKEHSRMGNPVKHKSHTKKNKTNPQHNMCRTPPHTNNTNKIGALLQTTEGKDKPNIVSIHHINAAC